MYQIDLIDAINTVFFKLPNWLKNSQYRLYFENVMIVPQIVL